MWVKTTLEKFVEYNITITTQRQLNDSEYIMHMELQDNPEFFLASRFDVEVKIYTEAEMMDILALEDVEGEIIEE